MNNKATLTERQRKVFNNGSVALIKKGGLFGLISGCLLSLLFILYSKPDLAKSLYSAGILIAAFTFLGSYVASKNWQMLKWTVWKIISKDLYFDHTTSENIQDRFGKPDEITEKKDKVIFHYRNTNDKTNDILLKKGH